jgi:hypothetical protein
MTPVTQYSILVPGRLLIATMDICGFTEYSTMVEIFEQEGWTNIAG